MVAAHFAAFYSRCCFFPNLSTVENNSQIKSLTFFLGIFCWLKRLSHRLIRTRYLLVLLLLSSAAPALSGEVTLAWDPNQEKDLEGYCVYFRQDTIGPSYSMYGCVTLQELKDPKNPKFMVAGLKRGANYCFVLTAYDKSGNESNHSNMACGKVVSKAMPWLSLLLDD